MTAPPTTDDTTTVRTATEGDVPRMVDALTAAFDDDPVINWFVRDDELRTTAMAGFFDIATRHLTLPHGEVYTTSAATGAALWAPPGRWDLGPDEVEPLLPDLAAAFGDAKFERSLEGMALMDAHHPDEPHFYLLLLGVRPGLQNRGIGSALLRTVLQRCDADGLPAYLEATSPRNVALYERHGFAVSEVLRLPSGPPLWLMWRPAGATAGEG